MAKKQTSSELSSLAAKYLRLTPTEIEMMVYQGAANTLTKDIHKLAASVLSQDEVKGKN